MPTTRTLVFWLGLGLSVSSLQACRQRLGDVFPGGTPQTPLEKRMLPIFQELEGCFEAALSFSPERLARLEKLETDWKAIRSDPSLDFSELPARDHVPWILKDLDRTFARVRAARLAQDFQEGLRQAVLLQHMVTELYEKYPPKSVGFSAAYQTLRTFLDLPPLSQTSPDPLFDPQRAHASRFYLMAKRWNRWAQTLDPKILLLVSFQDLEDSLRTMGKNLEALTALEAEDSKASKEVQEHLRDLAQNDYQRALSRALDLADPLHGEALKVKWFSKLMRKEGKLRDRARRDL